MPHTPMHTATINDAPQAVEVERKGYEGVIATITSECERLQSALAAAEGELEAAQAKVAKWKNR
jgi:hypothetical protein